MITDAVLASVRSRRVQCATRQDARLERGPYGWTRQAADPIDNHLTQVAAVGSGGLPAASVTLLPDGASEPSGVYVNPSASNPDQVIAPVALLLRNRTVGTNGALARSCTPPKRD